MLGFVRPPLSDMAHGLPRPLACRAKARSDYMYPFVKRMLQRLKIEFSYAAAA